MWPAFVSQSGWGAPQRPDWRRPAGDPQQPFPFVSQVAVGQRPQLKVFGDDWPTPDGTGVRDYIHVMDLAEGHRAALEVLLDSADQQLTLNLGSGQGHSVLEVVQAFENASGRPVSYELVARRPGDAASTVADPALAQSGWSTQRSLRNAAVMVGLAAGKSDGYRQPSAAAGGGHSHALLLRHGMRPNAPAAEAITLVSAQPTSLYSGLIPACLSGAIEPEACVLDLGALPRRGGQLCSGHGDWLG